MEGPAMSSSRYSHCAVGLGNGSIIVTGGYGGLNLAERLDIATGTWTQLPTLNPVRAQHGCALVNYEEEEGNYANNSGIFEEPRFLDVTNLITLKILVLVAHNSNLKRK